MRKGAKKGPRRGRRGNPQVPISSHTLVSNGAVTSGNTQTIALTIPGPLSKFRVTSIKFDFTSSLPVTCQISIRGTSSSSSDASATSMAVSTGFSHRTLYLRQPRKTDWAYDESEMVHVGWLYIFAATTFTDTSYLQYGITVRYSQIAPVPSTAGYSELSLKSPPSEASPPRDSGVAAAMKSAEMNLLNVGTSFW